MTNERKAYKKAWCEANREKVRAHNKSYYEAHSDERKAYNKAWREANRDKVKALRKSYYKTNKEKELLKINAYHKANKEKIKAYTKIYGKTISKKLTDSYIVKQLKISISDCPPSLIEAKRAQLQLYRATR